MKVLIRHAGAALFWTASGAWSSDPEQALTFLNDVRAQEYAFYHDIEDGLPIPASWLGPRGDLLPAMLLAGKPPSEKSLMRAKTTKQTTSSRSTVPDVTPVF
jgi:hypothetical protein